MAHWKKVLLLVVILLSGYQPVKPDSKNIILMESDIPATIQAATPELDRLPVMPRHRTLLQLPRYRTPIRTWAG